MEMGCAMAENVPDGLRIRPDILPPGFAYALIGSAILGLIIWALAFMVLFVGL